MTVEIPQKDTTTDDSLGYLKLPGRVPALILLISQWKGLVWGSWDRNTRNDMATLYKQGLLNPFDASRSCVSSNAAVQSDVLSFPELGLTDGTLLRNYLSSS